MTNEDDFKWYFENVMKERREAAEEYLSNLKAEFTPKVDNPDPAQLERLKSMNGEIMGTLRKFAEDALFTTKIHVDISNKREKE